VVPNRQYRYRVAGYSGVAQDFRVESKQLLAIPRNSGGGSSSAGSLSAAVSSGGTSATGGYTATRLVRFTVNPLSGTVTAQLVK
jgi:hypothetical protein